MERLSHAPQLVAALLIASVLRRRSVRDVDNQLSSFSPLKRFAITGSVLALLFAVCLFAAQFGLPGLLILFVTLIILVN